MENVDGWAVRLVDASERRNVGDHLPKRDRERIDARLAAAFAEPDPAVGLRKA